MVRCLTSAEALHRLKEFGYNELPASKPKNVWYIAYEVIKEPMFLLLIACATLYMIIGDYREGSIMVSTVFIIIAITFYQSQKTERALEALKKLSSPRALVIRDNIETRIPGRHVVPGDLVILNEGDRIPADGIIINTNHLTIDESLLTGESVPVLKNTSSKVFSGTLVVQGSGSIQIVTTGAKTEFGRIGTTLENINVDETRLQKEMKVLIRTLFIIGGFFSLALVFLFYYTRGDFMQSILNGLSAAMALLPEEFPVVLTIFLALGAWRLSKLNVLTRAPSAIETLGSATVLCSDKTGTITQNKMEVSAACLNGNIIYSNDFKNESRITDLLFAAHHASQINSADPMEKAISFSYEKNGSKQSAKKLRFIKEYPLSKTLLAMSRVFETEAKDKYEVYTKGAPESLFGLCTLSESEHKTYHAAFEKMATSGLRVLAVAKSNYDIHNLPEIQSEFKLNFIGLIGLEDPVRPEVPNAIKECYSAGIKVVMITGDYPVTAKSISIKAGLAPDGKIMTGEELNKLSNEELVKQIEFINVFARVIPEQKLRIINAFKKNNEVVAMTGDGVNDAPALKAADIGIAMGSKGTDVAREASSLVLLDDNFASIVSAIRSGRRIFDNLQKAMSYILAIHMPIIGLTLMPAFNSALPLILLPLHIVFMELIIDPVCSVAFESEQEEKSIMNRPPRNPNEKFFGINKMLFSAFQGILLFIMVLLVYLISEKEGHTTGEIRAITFSALIIGNIFLILTNLSKTRSFLSALFENNISLILIITLATGVLLAINFIPYLTSLFSFENPGYMHFIPSIIGATLLLLVLELIKYFKLRTNRIN